MLAHPRRSGVAWVVPLEADARRIPPGGRLRLHRTDDGGRTWREQGSGLPDASWPAVLRDAADGARRVRLEVGGGVRIPVRDGGTLLVPPSVAGG